MGKAGNVALVSDRKRSGYKGVQRCGSVWVCPVCSRKVSEERREELNELLAWARSERLLPTMLTLTFSHSRQDNLKRILGAMKRALKRFRQSRLWRALQKEGDVVATEVKYGQANGWHPHEHLLILLRAADEEKALTALEALRGEWSRCLKHEDLKCNEHGFDVQGAADAGDYISKWGAAEEITLSGHKSKGGLHPFGLLELAASGDKHAAVLFEEYVEAFHGKRQLVWSRGLKKKVKIVEVTDEEIAEKEEEGGEVIALFSFGQWKAICRVRGLRGELLDLAVQGGREAVEKRLQALQQGPPT
ncbi:MAG: protein rep [Rhodospirillales bacterium]|nr:protein rep [Rhodospirillales bacterium]